MPPVSEGEVRATIEHLSRQLDAVKLQRNAAVEALKVVQAKYWGPDGHPWAEKEIRVFVETVIEETQS